MLERYNRAFAPLNNFLLKLVASTVILLIAHWIQPLLFQSVAMILFTAGVIAFFGVMSDVVTLPRLGNGPTLLVDLILNWAIYWCIPLFFFPFSYVTWMDALILAICISPIEFGLHAYVGGAIGDTAEGDT